MATCTAGRRIGSFDALIFVAHEMWGMGGKVIVPIFGANNFDVTAVVKKGTAGGANVGWYFGGFASCRTFYPSSAAEGGRVEGAGEDVGHVNNFGDVPTGEITVEGGGTLKRAYQICNSRHIPCAQITGEGGGTLKHVSQICNFRHVP